mmetsp:Transcript_13880/g.32938  ORF Transcript_13880/g.32938 Transcript_13880/m.32938 type:complete len:475 (-) Transcript_13880:4904-6328(-)
MAIRQHHPEALLCAISHHLDCFRLLALAQGDGLPGHVPRHRQRPELARGVHARGQHKQQRGKAGGFVVDGFEVQRRGLHELGVQLQRHEDLHRRQHPVGPHAAHHNELLQRVQALVPLPGQVVFLRLGSAVPLLPVSQRLLQGGLEAFEGVQLAVSFHDVVPHTLVDPIRGRIGRLTAPVKDLPTEEEEGELGLIEVVGVLQHLRAKMQREQQLVALEDGTAAVLVHRERVEGVQVLDALFHASHIDLLLSALLNTLDVEMLIGSQGKLVHGIDGNQIVQHKVQDRGAQARGAVVLPLPVDLDHVLLRVGDLLCGPHTGDLGFLQRVDQAEIIQQRALGLRQQAQNLVLQLHQAVATFGHLKEQAVLVLLQARVLRPHDDAQQLVGETVQHHDEVHNGGLGGHLWGIVGVGKLGGDVEHEGGVVVQHVVAYLERKAAPAAVDDVLGQDRLQRWIQLLAHVLQEHRASELDGALQ